MIEFIAQQRLMLRPCLPFTLVLAVTECATGGHVIGLNRQNRRKMHSAVLRQSFLAAPLGESPLIFE
jgi:hypothetical protein